MVDTGEKKSVSEIVIETQRLRLRALSEDDAPFIRQLVNTPGWLKNIGDRNVQTDKDAAAYIRDVHFRCYRENGFGYFIVETKNNATSAGICGLLHRSTLPGPDLGFAFLPEFFGRGYAFESASAMLSYTASHFKIPVVYAIAIPSNLPSIKLLGKLGFTFKRNITMANELLSMYCLNT